MVKDIDDINIIMIILDTIFIEIIDLLCFIRNMFKFIYLMIENLYLKCRIIILERRKRNDKR